MPAAHSLKVVSARRIEDGETVYLTSCDAWTPEISYAEFLDFEDHDWRLAFAQRLKEVEGAELEPIPDAYLGFAA